MIYKLLTTAIIILGKLRDRFGGAFPKMPGHLYRQFPVRFDRALPWPEDAKLYLGMGCCDCGLTHVIIHGKSVTPKRPMSYDYKMRLGAQAYAKPDPKLGEEARAMMIDAGELLTKDEKTGEWIKETRGERGEA